MSRIAGFDAVRHLITTEPAARPQAFDLPALAESPGGWNTSPPAATRWGPHRATRAIVVAGAVDDVEACHAALRRWLRPVVPTWPCPLAGESCRTCWAQVRRSGYQEPAHALGSVRAPDASASIANCCFTAQSNQ